MAGTSTGVSVSLVERLFADLNRNTRRTYGYAWDVLAAYLLLPDRTAGVRHLAGMRCGDANDLTTEWIADMESKGLRTTTIATRIGALKGIMKRLRIAGVVDWTIDVSSPVPSPCKENTIGPTQVEIESVLVELRLRTDHKARRDLALLYMLYSTGLRREEAGALTVEDVDLGACRIQFANGNGDVASVHLAPLTKAALEDWLESRPRESKCVFYSLSPNHQPDHPLSGNGIWKIMQSYGLGHPHGIRHSGVTRILGMTSADARVAAAFRGAQP